MLETYVAGRPPTVGVGLCVEPDSVTTLVFKGVDVSLIVFYVTRVQRRL